MAPFSWMVWSFPNRYVEESYRWRTFDLHDWSRNEYEWKADPPGLWNDRVQRPSDTVRKGTGDCDDYALVAASCSVSKGRRGVGLAVMGHYNWGVPVPTHMIAYDRHETYSSGRIRHESPDEFVERDRRYDWVWTRRVR